MKINDYKVKIALAELGITQAQLADRCGISRQNISYILKKGRCLPATAGKIAAGLDVPVSSITEEG